jgi:hypothetical protein
MSSQTRIIYCIEDYKPPSLICFLIKSEQPTVTQFQTIEFKKNIEKIKSIIYVPSLISASGAETHIKLIIYYAGKQNI